jgi:hydroxypyruvate reductase
MAQALVDLLGERVSGGVVSVKEGYGGVSRLGPVQIREAGHPLPDQRGAQATEEMLELVSGAGENDLVLCVISGGGSALLTAPVEGFTLGDLRELTDALLASGAGIEEINTLRKQLDRVKGGGLARAAFPAQVASLILSDVVGNPLGMIASGPTVPNQETSAEAIEILERYDLLGFIPEGIFARWQTEENSNYQIEFDRVSNLLVGSNAQAAKAARRKARALGINAELLTTRLEGEAREVGEELAGVLRRMAEENDPFGRPGVLIAGGETTVTLRGSGRGGRNQELALAAVEGLDGLADAALVALATDGGDGVSVGAGAVVTGDTMARARALGLQPGAYLDENDSGTFFKALGDQIVTGPTRTNVNDLVFLFVF